MRLLKVGFVRPNYIDPASQGYEARVYNSDRLASAGGERNLEGSLQPLACGHHPLAGFGGVVLERSAVRAPNRHQNTCL